MLFSSVSIIDFEQVNVSLAKNLKLLPDMLLSQTISQKNTLRFKNVYPMRILLRSF